MAVEVRDPQWFGAVVRHATMLRGHATQGALGTAAGLSLNTIGNVVTGARPTYRTTTLQHLATGLGVPASQLIAIAAHDCGDDPSQAARALLHSAPTQGQVSFLVTAEGVDASLLEAALGAALASLTRSMPGAHTVVVPVD